jgi:hypothetical protein
MWQETEYRFDVAHVAGSDHINTLQPRSTNRFNIQKSYVLPTQCICVFCMDLRTNSDHFPVQY